MIEYSDNYSKTLGSLWQYHKDHPNDNIEQSESFKSKIKITGKTPGDRNTKDVEIVAPLKYLSNFWRTLEMPLIICEVNLILTWSPTCVICLATGETKFKITETKKNLVFTKIKERIQKFKETVYTSYIYKNELDKACFQHDMAYGDF